MRILHTSDWHIGRTFHQYQTLEASRHVLGSLPDLIRKHRIDIVAVAGDIYDTGSPGKDAVATLRDLLLGILQTGAKIVAISGNHDNATKLGFTGPFSAAAGLHLFTDVGSLSEPVEITDEHGPVDFYGIPFIEPSLHRHLEWMPSDAADQHRAVGAAMQQIRESISLRASKNRRTVVLSHTFVNGGDKETSDSERQITKEPLVVGGVDIVPTDVFAGVDYAALGHIHSRLELEQNIRYSGAAIHHSFKEAGKPRGGWLVDLLPEEQVNVSWVDFPVYRPLVELRGKFAEIMTKKDYDQYRDYFVQVVYTDDVIQIDAMNKLKTRFPFCANVVREPENRAASNTSSYRDRVKGKSDLEIIETFTRDVRNGIGLSDEERRALEKVLESLKAKADSK